MRRPLVTLVLVLILVLNACAMALSPVARAQDATPGSAPAAASSQLDLAAMVLLPGDLGRPDFKIGTASLEGPEPMADFQSSVSGISADEILATLTDAGYQHRYSIFLEKLAPTDQATPTEVAVRVQTAVTEYASEAGAAEGFAYLEQMLEDANESVEQEDIPLNRAFGDEAELTSIRGVTEVDGTPYQELNLTFRTGNLIGDVIVSNFMNEPVPQGQVEALAGMLQERMAEVAAGDAPGLSTRVARPDGPNYFEGYLVLDQTPIPVNDDADPDLAIFSRSVEGVSDAYVLREYLGEMPYLETWLYEFASAEEAHTWLETRAEANFAAQSFVPTDVEEVTDAPAIGEASRVFSFSVVLDPVTTTKGYVVFFQVGSIIARVAIDSIPEAPLSAVMEISQAQAACLAQGGCSEPIAIPAELLSTSPAATPVPAPIATPVAIEDPGLTGPTTFTAQDGTWQVTWDPSLWTVTGVDRSDGEVVTLASTRAISALVQMGAREGYRDFGGDAIACQADLAGRAMSQLATISDFSPVTNAQGTPEVQGDETESAATYQYVEAFDDGTEQTFSATFWCRTVIPGETVVSALATVDVDEAEQVMPDVEALLDGVIITPEGQE